MSEKPTDDRPNVAFVVIGAALVLAGVALMGRPLLEPLLAGFRPLLSVVRGAGWGIVIVLVGIALIARSGRAQSLASGKKRLYRSRSKKVLAGVLGGLSDYLGVDVVVLRVGFVIAALILDAGPAILAYIAAAIIIPEEPLGAAPPPSVASG